MRARVFILLGLACAGALAAQTAPSAGSARPAGSAPAVVPAVAPATFDKDKAAPDSIPPAPVFHEANQPDIFASVQKKVPVEARTPAQLKALLKTYIGHWQGESVMSALGAPHIFHDPVDMVCTLADENGVAVLSSVTTYTEGQEKMVEKQRMWVQNGHIVAEIRAPSETLHLAAHTQENSLVWMALDGKKTPLDFYQVETIDLSVTGGKMHVEGFDVQYTSQGSALIYNSADLTLVK